MTSLASLKIIYTANGIVAGSVGILAFVSPALSQSAVFQNAFQVGGTAQITGALWIGIAVVSILGIVRPLQMSPILVLQVIYKAAWLLAVALPAVITGSTDQLPLALTLFFILWVIVLPFVIPYHYLFSR